MYPPNMIKSVESRFNVPGWRCTWEHPGYFHVQQPSGKYYFAGNAYGIEDGKRVNQVRIDLHDNEGNLFQSWAIPYTCRLAAKVIIEAFANCITIFETEEIEGVKY